METRQDASPPHIQVLVEDSAQDLFENAPCGYLSTLPDGTLVRVNETFLTWTGYRIEQLVGRLRFQDLLTAGGRIFHETHYAPLLRMQGKVREIAVDIVCADGRSLPALVNSTVALDDAGAPRIVRTTIFDATERREYERELVRARQRAEASETRARSLAQTLQSSLVPPAPPGIPGLDIAAIYRPAGDGYEVGGDFYDVFETAPGDWALILGDVQGKGVEAATVTALVRYTARAHAMRTRRPHVVLGSLNTALAAQYPDRFCTAVYARIRLRHEGVTDLTVASAGHPLPLHVSSAGTVRPIGAPGTLLGAFEDPMVTEAGITLAPGDTVLFYTDGITEARRGSELYGEERLIAALKRYRGEPSSALAAAVVEESLGFQGGRTKDDIAVVVLRRPD